MGRRTRRRGVSTFMLLLGAVWLAGTFYFVTHQHVSGSGGGHDDTDTNTEPDSLEPAVTTMAAMARPARHVRGSWVKANEAAREEAELMLARRAAARADAAKADEALAARAADAAAAARREAKKAEARRQREDAADSAAAVAASAHGDRDAGDGGIYFDRHEGKSCQNYAEEHVKDYTLADAKAACIANTECNAIECSHLKTDHGCTLRGSDMLVDYEPVDCYRKIDPENIAATVNPAYNDILQAYPFQQVTTQSGKQVNIILVRSPFRSNAENKLYEKYKDEILFMGISSFEDYPLDAGNPFSSRTSNDVNGVHNGYLGLFPGFLHMMHEPERAKLFPPHVKTLLMSQSDFQLPGKNMGAEMRDYAIPKKYDFTYAQSGQDVATDCVGWASYAKNWSFVKEALEVMCGEYNMTGVLVATAKDGQECTIPPACKGKMIQTGFLNQKDYFDYLKHSRFGFVPQVHDASPRISTQALVLDVPLLMNRHISGGWKYINEKTGEFFTDMTDIRASLDVILRKSEVPFGYEPRKWVLEHYGNDNSGKRLLEFVKENFGDRVKLPKGTTHLLT